MEVVVGTYDEVILGFRLVKVGEAVQIESSFTDHSHAGCVKCVAVSPKGVLASGGTDENIRLIDLKKKKEMGSLVHHSGSITDIVFHKGFMFSSSEDGYMCLWKTQNWDCLRTFKGHKSAVHSVSVHPSGKLALTVGKDKTMHTWNLMTGKCAYVTNLKQAADIVKWSLEGDTYAVVICNRVDLYSVKTTSVMNSFQTGGRINCLEFLQNDIIVYCGEGGTCVIQNISQTTPILQYDTGLTRIKGLCVSPSPMADTHHNTIVTVAGSEGQWIVYKLLKKQDKFDLEVIVHHNTNFRITCLAVYCKPATPDLSEGKTASESVEDIAGEAEQTPSHKQKTANIRAAQGKREKQKRKFKGEIEAGTVDNGEEKMPRTKKMKQKTKQLETVTKTKQLPEKSKTLARLKKKKKKPLM